MWVTGSWRTERLLLASWIVSAVVNVWLMWVLPGAETIPFHLVWIGLSIIWGLTAFRVGHMWVVLGCVAVLAGLHVRAELRVRRSPSTRPVA